MRPPRLPRTTASRLALGYATLFALSTACLLAVVYLAVTDYAHDQHQDLIEAEWESLAAEARVSGLDAAVLRIRAWRTLDQSRPAEYLLLDDAGRRRAGDLAVPALSDGWSETVALDEDGDAEPILAYAAPVAGGRLVVAAETQDLSELRNAILSAFAWAGAFAILLAIVGGLVIRLVFSRRIALFNRTTGRIVEGRLSERVPLSSADDEFDQLARNVNAMLERIEDLVENLRQVSNDVAHDLRTPLTRLRQRLEAARATPRESARDDEAFERAIEESDEILATFAALLRIAEIEAGTRRSGFKQVDLSGVFSTLQEAYEPAAEDQERTLSADIEPDVSVRGDPELLTQMLSNLIENALRHTPSGGEVQMTLARSGTGVVGAVSDHGPGIPEDAREKVFRRFYRGETSRGSAGNGLGLSVVAAVAARHRNRGRRETAAVVAGFVAVGGLMGFLEIAEDTAEGDTQDADHRVLASLRAGGNPTNPVGPEWLEIAAADFTALGSIAVLLSIVVLVSGFLVFLRRFGSATLLWVSFGIGIGLSQFLKAEFGRDRPEEAYRVVDGLNASFPSGHAMLSGIVYFTVGALLARVLTRHWQRVYVLTSVVLLTALVGASRVYLGVHWMSDVIGGWALGLTVAMTCWLLAHLLERRLRPRSSRAILETG